MCSLNNFVHSLRGWLERSVGLMGCVCAVSVGMPDLVAALRHRGCHRGQYESLNDFYRVGDVGQSTFTRIVPVALPWVMLLA